MKIYEILDGDGKVLYKIPANRPSSGLVSAAGSTLQVRAEDCSVVVKAEAGMGVEVVTAQGIVAWHGTTDGSGRTRTDALVAGVYIVSCSGRTAKVVIK